MEKMNQTPLLQVKNLKTYFHMDEGTLKAVDDVSFSVMPNTTLGIIGESGCGKSVTVNSVLRTIQPPGEIISGNIIYTYEDGRQTDIMELTSNSREMRSIRGKEISMIFQEPMASLSPVHTIGKQMVEMMMVHKIHDNKNDARAHCIELLGRVGLPQPERNIDDYPHQLSGGMCQRAMIALALSCSPRVLIADEPTTALDVTVQATIIDLMNELKAEFGMSIVYITHDLGVIAEIADEIAVMYLGKVVEKCGVRELFKNPQHPYTRRLLQSIPKLNGKGKQKLDAIAGNVPVPIDMQPQCGFCSRCDEATEGRCDRQVPELIEVNPGHFVSCFAANKEGRC
jgi:oligopeptide/dipeptide ABC transporter ATP-binding protein